MPDADDGAIHIDSDIFGGVPAFRFVRILFGAGTYVFSAGQSTPGPVLWEGEGQSSILFFDGEGTFLTFAFPSNGLAYNVSAGVRDLYIGGPGLDSDSIGLQIGPADGGSGSGAGVTVRDTAIRQFGAGVQIGDNAYNVAFERAFLEGSGVGVNIPAGLIDSGESIDFQDSFIADGNSGISIASPGFELWISNTSLDFFHDYGVRLTANSTITAVGINFEETTYAPFIFANNGSVSMVGGQFVSDANGGTWPQYVMLDGPANFSATDVRVSSFGSSLDQFVEARGTGQVSIFGNQYQPAGAVKREIGRPAANNGPGLY